MEGDDTVSNIRVLFNNNLKTFIKNINKIADLKDSELNYIMREQEMIREYIISHQDEINLCKGSLSKGSDSYPDMFAIMICLVVSNIDKYSNFNDVLNNVRQGDNYVLGLYSSTEEDEEQDDDAHFKCACGHSCKPRNLFRYVGDENNGIIIGVDCCKKYKFIEPEQLTQLQKESQNNPSYKKYIEKNEKQNMEKKQETIQKSLIKNKINMDNFNYIGGNFKSHINNFVSNKRIFETKYDFIIGDITDFIENKCILCKQYITKVILLWDKNEIICLCIKCSEMFNKIEKQYVCEDCDNLHDNKKDNYCNECRLKTICVKCNKKEICDNFNRCKSCKSNFKFCSTCNKNTINNDKYKRCKECFNKLRKCSCGKRITNNKYFECYECYTNN